jgi:predicted nicotinamide N-methyase
MNVFSQALIKEDLPAQCIQGAKLSYPLARYSFLELDFHLVGARNLDEIIDLAFARYESTGEEELFERECPYFCVPWPSGVQLAKLALAQAPRWKGLRVLELGCGLALPTLVLAKAGLTDLLALDIHPDAYLFFERNAAELRGPQVPKFIHSSWEALPPSEVILVADGLYDRRQPQALVEALARESTWREVWVVDPERGYWQEFLQRVRAESWTLALGQWGKGQWVKIGRP